MTKDFIESKVDYLWTFDAVLGELLSKGKGN